MATINDNRKYKAMSEADGDKLFGEYNHTVAQILLTKEDIEHERRCENFRNTIFRLLELGALPVINENDTVATDEIVIGDNDTLAAIVAANLEADLLILLSDIDGLYTCDPHKHPDASLLPVVRELTPDIIALGEGKGSALGTGGMKTKLHAAEIAMNAGIDMVIANGAQPSVLYRIADGEAVGTRFLGKRG